MWNVLNETVPRHVYAVNKEVLINIRDWCKELRSEKQCTPRYHHHHHNNTYRKMKATRSRHG